MSKVFAIGFQKTGTTSLGRALSLLGYSVCGYDPFRKLLRIENLGMEPILDLALSLADRHDAFKDTPWPVLYRELDQRYPGSKFILTVRDTDKWIRSVVNDFGAHPNAIHTAIYGCPFPRGHEQAWIDRYERHNAEVLEHFRDRPQDLLALHLDRGEVRWEAVCPFLGRDVPNTPWPHANKRRDKKFRMFVGRWAARMRLAPTPDERANREFAADAPPRPGAQ